MEIFRNCINQETLIISWDASGNLPVWLLFYRLKITSLFGQGTLNKNVILRHSCEYLLFIANMALVAVACWLQPWQLSACRCFDPFPLVYCETMETASRQVLHLASLW